MASFGKCQCSNAACGCGGQGGKPVEKSDKLQLCSLGCFQDGWTRLFKDKYQAFYSENSPQRCAKFCHEHGFPVSGVEYSDECYCGKSLPIRGRMIDNSRCSMPCTWDKQLKCGGGWAIQVSIVTKEKISKNCIPLPSENNPMPTPDRMQPFSSIPVELSATKDQCINAHFLQVHMS